MMNINVFSLCNIINLQPLILIYFLYFYIGVNMNYFTLISHCKLCFFDRNY